MSELARMLILSTHHACCSITTILTCYGTTAGSEAKTAGRLRPRQGAHLQDALHGEVEERRGAADAVQVVAQRLPRAWSWLWSRSDPFHLHAP